MKSLTFPTKAFVLGVPFNVPKDELKARLTQELELSIQHREHLLEFNRTSDSQMPTLEDHLNQAIKTTRSWMGSISTAEHPNKPGEFVATITIPALIHSGNPDYPEFCHAQMLLQESLTQAKLKHLRDGRHQSGETPETESDTRSQELETSIQNIVCFS